MREIMRSLLSANLLVTGIIMFIGSLIVFAGSTFLLKVAMSSADGTELLSQLYINDNIKIDKKIFFIKFNICFVNLLKLVLIS